MIKVNEGNVEIKGSKVLVKSELTTLLHALREDELLKDEDIDRAVEMSRKSEEELHGMMNDIMEDFIKKLKELKIELGD